jgi:hypothetical protein
MKFFQGRQMTGRILDPVFLSMIGAVALAVMASIAVRAVAGAHPAQAMQPPVEAGHQ